MLIASAVSSDASAGYKKEMAALESDGGKWCSTCKKLKDMNLFNGVFAHDVGTV